MLESIVLHSILHVIVSDLMLKLTLVGTKVRVLHRVQAINRIENMMGHRGAAAQRGAVGHQRGMMSGHRCRMM